MYAAGRDGFARFLKPRVHETLEAIGLDLVYERATGDHMWYRESGGALVRVLDMVGGFGASLFGHNHPELVAKARQLLDEERPFNAQASVRALAGRLAQRLSERVGRTDGRDYVVTLASTGTEAVEAAIKHAELELVDRNDAILAGMVHTRRELALRSHAGTAHVPTRTFERASRLLGRRIARADELFSAVQDHARLAFEAEPAFIALDRGFHGKSTGSLSLTANPEFRSAWRRIGLKTLFLEMGDEPAVARAIHASRLPYLDFVFAADGALELEERHVVNIAGCFLEPIQGEGGVRPLPPSFARAIRDAADVARFPVVMDEIQSGMGRTGTFLASEALEVRGDYYLLSKSLGGGLAKISALLVDRARYVPRFGMLHTSTFVEDDWSSVVALGALDLLDADGGALLASVRARGEHLRRGLTELQARWPDVIADVRGAGLLLGIELADMGRSPSAFLRVASEQGKLGYLAAAYLLHEERVRVLPTLSSPRTLRVQPSAYIGFDEIDGFVAGLDRLARVLRERDTDALARHLVGRAGKPSPAARARGGPPVLQVSTPGAAGAAFLGHFLDPEDVRDWDPGFAGLTAAECEHLLDRTRRVLRPFVQQATTIRSPTGAAVDVTLIGLPFTSQQVIESFRAGDAKWARAMVSEAIAIAKERGACTIGLGGYTSIITDNGREVVDDGVLVTSGNSLTAAAALDTVIRAKERLALPSVRLGILGALGNIGAVLAELLAEHVDSVVLVGRPGAERRLAARASALGATARRKLGPAAQIVVSTDMRSLRSCQIIVTATNSARPVLGAEHLGAGPVVVCDVAAPGDVLPDVARARPDVLVLKGGMVRLPLGQQLRVPGVPVAPGTSYGCLGETILMGLARADASLSLGALTVQGVRRARELALEHGFAFDDKPSSAHAPNRQPLSAPAP